MPNKEIEHITTLLGNYLNDIKLKGKFNWLSDHVHAEYLFKRLLNILFDWKLSHTEDIFGHNTPDIDLVSRHTGVVVQITANSRPTTKIKDTLSGYNTNWKSKYPKLKILFIQPDLDYEKYKSEEYELITYEKIIQEIQNRSSIDRRIILEFLRQELSNYYDSNPYSLSIIQTFKDAFVSKSLGSGLINNYYLDKDLIYFSELDRTRVQKFTDSLVNEKTKFALIGPPCSGKTSLLFELSKAANGYLIKSYYIDLEIHGNQETLLLEDIRKIGSQDALLIIDNAHDHASISRKIFNISIDYDIRTLFVYRRTSNDNLTDRLQNEDFDLVETTDSELDDNNIENKFIGIIDKRIQYLKKTRKDSQWVVGNMPNILRNNESNFLKLSISLYYWEQNPRFKRYRLDQIKSDEIYKSFYSEHFKNSDSEILITDIFLCSFLYQYGIPFYLKNEHDAEISTKGFIKKIPLAGSFVFPHTEYAKLLRQSIQHWKGFDDKNIELFVKEYLINQNPKNIPLILRELANNDTKLICTILRYPKTQEQIAYYYSEHSDYKSILILLDTLNTFKNELETVYVENLLNTAFSDNTSIRNYEKLGEQICVSVSQCLKNYSLTNKNLHELASLPQLAPSKKESFFGVATEIRKKYRDEKFVYKELHKRNFSVWLKLMNDESKYGKVAEGIACLYKTSGCRQLSLDLYQKINIQDAFNNLKNQPIDVCGKALSDMSELYAFDNRRKANQLLSLLLPYLQNQDFKSIGLLKYSIGISHIGKVNHSRVVSLFPQDSTLQQMFEDVNPNELSQRIIEIKNIFPTKEKLLLQILKSVINRPDFISRNSEDPRGLIKLVKQLKNLGFKISKSKYTEITDAILANKVSDNLLLAEIGVLINSLQLDLDILRFYNPKKIEFSLAHHQISLNHLEQILLTNAKKINRAFAERILKDIPVKAINISATKSTISFSQMSSVYYRLYGLESSKNEIFHMQKALEEYAEFRNENFINKANKANSWHLIEGISKFYEINKKVTNEVLVPILEERIKNCSFRGVALTNIIQPLKRLNNLDSNELSQLTKKTIQSCEPELISNSKLLDIGKISTGLRELSSFDVKASKRIFEKMILTISEKIKLENHRKDLANRIIPELEIASDYDIDKIGELKKVAGIE